MVYTAYGKPEVLKLKDVTRPVPNDREVLVKVRAASANALDWRRFTDLSPASRFFTTTVLKQINTVLGADLAGQVEAVGAAVTQFQAGDEVFGVAAGNAGAFAEYALAREDWLAAKPANLSFEAAAATPVAALTALQGLRNSGHIQPGQKVLVYGASGGVGTFAVQFARAFGADVTATCSRRNLDLVRSLGADQVLDYAREDFSRDGQRYDLILAANGYRPIGDYRRALAPRGTYVALGGEMSQFFQALLLGPVLSGLGRQKLGFMGIAKVNAADLALIGELLAAGKIRPVIDRCYPLSEAAEAIRYLVDEHARGKVVLTVSPTA
jgi:NADPH:quinone reductase-like Zn-dependent oxidoreductase